MTTETIKGLHLCTRLDIWYPRYSSAYSENGERVALLAKYKIDNGSPIIIVDFSKAKHLAGQRFCIKRDIAMSCEIDSNGTIPCYAVPMSKFNNWQTPAEIADIAKSIFDH